ncbi:hypothetical protein SSS_09158 [Sarcoptes scabiei]|nr:hypothetical protein SSS_09158 [Sarcoptes scabiei]
MAKSRRGRHLRTRHKETEKDSISENDQSKLEDNDFDDTDDNNKEENSLSDTNDDQSFIVPKKRGRKRKAELSLKDKYVPDVDPARRGIMAQGGSLRRRDTLKSTSRYSPPPASTRKSLRNEKLEKPESKKIETESIDPPKIENIVVSSRKKAINQKNTISSPSRELRSKSDDEKDKKANSAVSKASVSQTNKKTSSSVTSAEENDIELEPPEKISKSDHDHKLLTRSNRRKSSESNVLSSIASEKPENIVKPIKINEKTNSIATTKSSQPIRSVTLNSIASASKNETNQSVALSKPQTITISATAPTITIPKLMTTSSVANKIPTILKPSISTTNANKGPVRKPLSLSKYLETLPEIDECIHNDGIPDTEMQKLPDKILLVNSELPLELAVSVENQDVDYLFRFLFSDKSFRLFILFVMFACCAKELMSIL